MRTAHLALILTILSFPTSSAWAAGAVALVHLDFRGDINDPTRTALSERFIKGFKATNLVVLSEEKVREALSPGQEPCKDSDAECLRALAAKLLCRYLVGGSVEGEDRFFSLSLWMADGYSGQVLARIDQRCEICGIQEVTEKMELLASALRSKVAAASLGKPARLVIGTNPEGASLSLDGDVVGPAPKEMEIQAGTHQIVASATGYLPTERTIMAVEGVEERLTLKLIPIPQSAVRRTAGWISISAGAASLAAGIILLALDGRGENCSREKEECSRYRQGSPGGWTLTGLGIGALGVGTYLLLKKERKPTVKSRIAFPLGLSNTF